MSSAVSKSAEPYEQRLSRPEVDSVAAMCRFFMKDGPVHQTLARIARTLEDMSIPYAVAGGMALGAHRYERATVGVDVLLNPDGWKRARDALDGLGYTPLFEGSKNLRDVQTGVRIEFLLAGQYPGDGKPKPVAFPDSRSAGEMIQGIRYLRLPVLIELKLASGMTNAGRLKDLADVQELIRTLKLDEGFAAQLNPYVREKYAELLRGVRQDVSDHGSP